MRQTKLLKAITMKITTLLISLSLLPMLSHAASNPYNYVTSVKVNQVELNAQDFAPPYTAYLNFGFKNGQLSSFAIQQAVAC